MKETSKEVKKYKMVKKELNEWNRKAGNLIDKVAEYCDTNSHNMKFNILWNMPANAMNYREHGEEECAAICDAAFYAINFYDKKMDECRKLLEELI